MTTVTPPADVAEPTPEAAGFGLYSAAQVVDGDNRTHAGVRWEPTVCGLAGSFPVGCAETAGWPLPYVDGIPTVTAAPFGVSAGQECKIVGVELAHLRDLATARLRYTEQRAVERAYWTGAPFGAGVTTPHLAAGDDVQVLAAAPVKASLAVGLLEEYLGNLTGVIGVLHAPRVAFGALKGFVAAKGGGMRTELGTRVAFGTGYPGTAPDAAPGATRPDPEVAWIYATGPVQVVRSGVLHLPDDPRDALDRETNDARVQAVRIVSVGHSCGLAAVPVNLTA